jgi:hypothetical protein
MLGAVKHFRALREEVMEGRRSVLWGKKIEKRLKEEMTRRVVAKEEEEARRLLKLQQVADQAAKVEGGEVVGETAEAAAVGETTLDDFEVPTIDVGEEGEEVEWEEDAREEEKTAEKKSTYFSIVVEMLTGVDIYMEPVMLSRLKSFEEEVAEDDETPPPSPQKAIEGEMGEEKKGEEEEAVAEVEVEVEAEAVTVAVKEIVKVEAPAAGGS